MFIFSEGEKMSLPLVLMTTPFVVVGQGQHTFDTFVNLLHDLVDDVVYHRPLHDKWLLLIQSLTVPNMCINSRFERQAKID